MQCLSTTYTCFYHLDSACAVDCLSYIPEVGGTTNAMYLLERMGVSFSSTLPFLPPLIIVLADFRSSFYTNRGAGPQSYYPEQNFGDRAKRMLKGATGDYEDAILQVVKYVDSNYPTSFNRVVFGQEMGGYGAVKVALNNPFVFIAAASQSGYLNPLLFGDMFSQYRELLNNQFPSIFDVYGYGSFSSSTTGEFKLPTDPSQAFNLSFVAVNDPVVLATPTGSLIPVFMEVGSLEITNPAVYNGTKNFCQIMTNKKSSGEAYLYSSGDGTPSSWVLNLGYILLWLGNILNGATVPVINCAVFN